MKWQGEVDVDDHVSAGRGPCRAGDLHTFVKRAYSVGFQAFLYFSKATRPRTQPHCRLEQPHHALERGVGL